MRRRTPASRTLCLRLLLTDYAHHLKGDVPEALRGLLLPRTGWPNTIVCLAGWRDSSSKASSYDRLSAEAADILKIEDHLPDLEIDQLVDVMTFLVVEKRIASSLRERVQTTAATINAEEVRTIARRRQAGHWASANVVGAAEAPDRRSVPFTSPDSGSGLLRPAKPAPGRVSTSPTPPACTGPTKPNFIGLTNSTGTSVNLPILAKAEGWNILKPLRDEVERCYVNWYLPTLAVAWGKFIERTGRTAGQVED